MSVDSGYMDLSNNLISFVRVFCRIFGFWPLSSETTGCRLLLWKLMHWMWCLNEFCGTLAMLNGLGCCFTSLAEFVKSFVEVVFMLEILFNFVYYRRRASKFQRLIANMERFFETSNPRHETVKLNDLQIVSYALTAIFIVGGLLFVFAPLLHGIRTTPVNTVYFIVPREEYWGHCVTYGLNILHIVIAGSVVLLDMLVILIIWHAACKFRLIGRALENIDETRLKSWITEHQNTISYAAEINCVIGPLAVKSTVAVALYMVVSGLVVTHNLPVFELTKFLIVTAFSMLRFLSCSWAADTMTENARDVAQKIYESSWVDECPKRRRDKLMIMQRCQKPVTIHAKGVLPAWSLKFCGQVLYTIFTLFSSLRAILRM